MAYSTVSPVTYLERANFLEDPACKSCAAARSNTASMEICTCSYGLEHGRCTGMLASSIAATFGIAGNELWLADKAGMFHDLGRKAISWRDRDSDHGRRSAEAALHTLVKDSDWKALGEAMLQRLARIIARHDLSGPPPTSDPIAIALWDADCLEAARLSPGTGDGARIVQERYAKVITPWAKDRGRQQKWIEFRSKRSVTVRTSTAGKWVPGWDPLKM